MARSWPMTYSSSLLLDLARRGDVGEELSCWCRGASFLVEDRLAQLDALAADVDVARPFDQRADVAIALAAERTEGVAVAAGAAGRLAARPSRARVFGRHAVSFSSPHDGRDVLTASSKTSDASRRFFAKTAGRVVTPISTGPPQPGRISLEPAPDAGGSGRAPAAPARGAAPGPTGHGMRPPRMPRSRRLLAGDLAPLVHLAELRQLLVGRRAECRPALAPASAGRSPAPAPCRRTAASPPA